MVSALLMIAAAWAGVQQAAAPVAAPATVPTCWMVAPNGDSIGFKVGGWDGSGDMVSLVGTRGSVWPSRTLVGQRMRGEDDAFAFGGADGLVLRLDPSSGLLRTATLHRRAGNRAGLPLAHGYCRPERPFDIYLAFDPDADPRAIGDDIAAFSPVSWPSDDCALLLGDGRRLRLSYRTSRDGEVELANAELWPQGRVRARMERGRPSAGVGQARFSRRRGPSGTEFFHVDHGAGLAVKLITFRDVGGEAAGRPAFAICGYTGIVRRPRVDHP